MLPRYSASLKINSTLWIMLFIPLNAIFSLTWSPSINAKCIIHRHANANELPSNISAPQFARLYLRSPHRTDASNLPLKPRVLATSSSVSIQTTTPRVEMLSDLPTDLPTDDDVQIATLARTLGQNPRRDAVERLAESQLNRAINARASAWLQQYGQAQIGINVNSEGRFIDSHADILLPLYEREALLFYTQWGIRDYNRRWVGNGGSGMRYLHNATMYGLNLFYDHDVSGNNRRLGIGTELARDYLTLSVNGYLRLNGWHASRDLTDFNERAANGYDIRIDGWLPSHPQFGAALSYERYFGKGVALFDIASRQPNPQALTAEVNYTPIPLLTVAAGQRIGTTKRYDTHLNLYLRYRLGEDLARQLDRSYVTATKDLSGGRYDLVKRAYTPMLDYQQERLIWLTLPPPLRAGANQPLHLHTAVTSKYTVSRLEWDVSALIAAGGRLVQQGTQNIELITPPYQVGNSEETANSYAIGATAVDSQGNRSRRVTTTLHVTSTPSITSRIDITKNDALADGRDHAEMIFTLIRADGKPAQSTPVIFSTSSQAALSTQATLTDAAGQAALRVTHTQAMATPIQVEAMGHKKKFFLNFMADARSARIDTASLVMSDDYAVADGEAQNTLRGRVIDANGNPLVNAEIAIRLEREDIGTKITPSHVISQQDGGFEANITSIHALNYQVFVSVNGKEEQLATTFVRFAEWMSNLDYRVVDDNHIADGVAQNKLLVVLRDSQRRALANRRIAVITDQHIHPSAQWITTDAHGRAEFGVASTRAGATKVSIKVGRWVKTVVTTFISDSASATIKQYEIVSDRSVADGISGNVVKALIVDKSGNAVAGHTVTFTANHPAAHLKAQQISNEYGEVYARITSKKVIKTDILLTVNGATQSRRVRFITDILHARIDRSTLTMVQDGAIANGMARNRVQGRVTDKMGKPIANCAVQLTVEPKFAKYVELSSNKIRSDRQGYFHVELASYRSGLIQLSFSINERSVSLNTLFIADAASAAIYDHKVIINHSPANGIRRNSVLIKVKDQLANPVPDQVITLSAGAGIYLEAPQVTTDAEGVAVFRVAAKRRGSVVVRAHLGQRTEVITMEFGTDRATGDIELHEFVANSAVDRGAHPAHMKQGRTQRKKRENRFQGK